MYDKIYGLALDQVKNFGKVTVSTGYTNLDTVIVLNAGNGSKLPDPAAGNFNLVWWDSTLYVDPSDDTNVEIVRCTARTGDTLTVVRGQEGTTGTNKNTPGHIYKMILSPTGKMFTDIPTDAQSRVDTHAAVTLSVHGITDTSKLVSTLAAASGQYVSAKYTTTITLNWNNGNVQYIVLANGAQTFTFANPRDGGRYMIILKQPASGAAGTVTWPISVLWSGGTAPTLTTTNGKVDIMTFVYDGTNVVYYGGSSLNY